LEVSSQRPGRFTPGEKAPGTHWIGGWVNPRANLDDVEKKKFLPLQELNSDPSVVQSVASRYTDCANLSLSLSFQRVRLIIRKNTIYPQILVKRTYYSLGGKNQF
jgi:hypothetical protein